MNMDNNRVAYALLTTEERDELANTSNRIEVFHHASRSWTIKRETGVTASCVYRTVSTPWFTNWGLIDDSFSWIAMDRDKEVYVYKGKPHLTGLPTEHSWYCHNTVAGVESLRVLKLTCDREWKNSLEQRVL